MHNQLERSDAQFLADLHRSGPGTVQEIGANLGVTATAVRQRLTRLEGAGLIGRRLVRAGRGRPHYVYEVTVKARRQLGDNYGDLALILWREVQRIEDPTLRRQVTGRVREAMVQRFGTMDGMQLAERLRRLTSGLVSHGYDVEVSGGAGLPILREHSCPYQELADEDRGICELEQEVFEQVLGVPVRLTQCCMDGHRGCEFEVGEASHAAGAEFRGESPVGTVAVVPV